MSRPLEMDALILFLSISPMKMIGQTSSILKAPLLSPLMGPMQQLFSEVSELAALCATMQYDFTKRWPLKSTGPATPKQRRFFGVFFGEASSSTSDFSISWFTALSRERHA